MVVLRTDRPAMGRTGAGQTRVSGAVSKGRRGEGAKGRRAEEKRIIHINYYSQDTEKKSFINLSTMRP